MPVDPEDANRDERHLFSGDIVAHTVESIVALDTEWRLRALYFTTLLICVAAIAAIFVVKVDVSAMGAGLIRPLTDKMEIAAPLAGQVVEVIGRTDLRVKRGDRLMVLSTASLEASLAGNRAEQERAVRELHDLDFLVRLLGDYKPADSLTASKFSGGNKTGASVVTRANLEPKPEIVVHPISASPAPETLLQSPVYAKDYVSYLAEAEELRSNREQAEHELRRYETLFVSNTVSGQEVDQRRYELQQARLREQTARKQRVTRWQAEFAARSRALDNLGAEAVRIYEEMANCTIKAPTDGTLVDFAPLAPGAFVQQGQRLGDLSPDDALVAEVYVSPRDVGQIQPGQEVRMQVDAFHYTEWGMLRGTVKRVADDFTMRGNGSQPVFRVFVTPESLELAMRNGLRAEVRKGMTLQARFVVARRSLFSLLYESASRWMNPHEKLDDDDDLQTPAQAKN
jgi:membrane fusion protein, peptide pheromone/bacteriocin exporter